MKSASTSAGSPAANAARTRCSRGTTSIPGWRRTGSGRTGATPSTLVPSLKIAAGPPATTAGYALVWICSTRRGTCRSSVRVRVRYRKQGRLRFISAIDVGRVWERALRRADLPIAYSEGFSPHPKVSFTDALPLGCDSTGEYGELTFAVPIDLPSAVSVLNAAFPDGMDVLFATAVEEGGPRIAKLLQASLWDVAYPPGTSLTDAAAQALAAETLIVARERKGETVHVDIRPAVHHLSCDGPRLRVTVHHADHLPADASVAIRPTEVDAALRGFQTELPQPALVSRLAQGRPEADGLVEALSGERYEPLGPRLQRQFL
ncbi:MAG: DUF2344 domain-containing protein [Nitriliruptorales bacterium]|nr:DUF2344 domain-containing protein [Nitriliruptorales bacterium]